MKQLFAEGPRGLPGASQNAGGNDFSDAAAELICGIFDERPAIALDSSKLLKRSEGEASCLPFHAGERLQRHGTQRW